MNRQLYRLVFNRAIGMYVPRSETTRGNGKSRSLGNAMGMAVARTLLIGSSLGGAAYAQLPIAMPASGGSKPFVSAGQAGYQTSGNQAFVNQVGNKAILNWQKFNVGAGNTVQFRQVDSLGTNNAVAGASFTTLNRIWDANPSVIAGSITQAAGQKANVIMVNSNGIAFMGGSQVNLNSFTASTLDIANSFITNSFLTSNTVTPQFENALDGTEGKGSIEVMEGARITAGNFGRVMLIAPTVINRGTISAPDGQVIAAAGTKVYLRSASGQDDSVSGLLVEVDSSSDDSLRGHATNFGDLSADRGNVTMVGYAVNQMGIARATTSVVSNGSVYLLAKDRATSNSQSLRGGRAVLGANSTTSVSIETADTTATTDSADAGAGLDKASRILVQGQDIRMAGGASITARSGKVDFIAQDNPGVESSSDPFLQAGAALTSNAARIHIASGASINVAGLENVEVSAARNSVEVELRGDELKDSPVNRTGALRGQKVYVDVTRALALANAGKSTLIAKDSLESYAGRMERTAAERATAGGSVSIKSQGEAIVEQGAAIDLSGGSVKYTSARVNTTVLRTGSTSVDIADANAETKYDSISSQFVIDYGRWGKTETVKLSTSSRTDPGYIEGKNAGSLSIVGLKSIVMQASPQGRTTTGANQHAAGIQPLGAKLGIGSSAVSGDFKQNQRIVIGRSQEQLPAGFAFGQALPDSLAQTLSLSPDLWGEDQLARLEIFSNQAVEVRDALRTAAGGSVAITAKGVDIGADVTARAGSLAFTAKANAVDLTPYAYDVNLNAGTTLSTRGNWINLLPKVSNTANTAQLMNGGSIAMKADGNVSARSGSLIDTSAGARVNVAGKLSQGTSGSVNLEAQGTLRLDGSLNAYTGSTAASLTLRSNKVQIGGVADPDALNLDPLFFQRGGFGTFSVYGAESVVIADGVKLRPTLFNRELIPQYRTAPSGTDIESFSAQAKRADAGRQAVNVGLYSQSPANAASGRILVGDGAALMVDNKASVTLSAKSNITVLGTISAPGGTISATVSRSDTDAFDPAASVWLGPKAVLDTAGVAQTYADGNGQLQGKVLNGGSISLSAVNASVVAQSGSRMTVAGAAPVVLGVMNEAGSLGRAVGSDGGSISINSSESTLLDGSMLAQGGSDSQRGGSFSFSIASGDNTARTAVGAPVNERSVRLADSVSDQSAGMAAASALPGSRNGNVQISASGLNAAGFDNLRLASQDVLTVGDGVQLGSNRSSLRSIELSAGRIAMDGGSATVQAHAVSLGGNAATTVAPVSGTGTLNINAALIDIAGPVKLSGLANANFDASEAVRFSGNAVSDLSGSLSTVSDLSFTAPVAAPASGAAFTINAPGKTVRFARTGPDAATPLSVLGSLTVKAQNILQNGTVWAPFGLLDFQATDLLQFGAGSLTSVSGTGSVQQYGRIENGRTWVTGDTGATAELADLTQKTIRAKGATINMQSGASMDLRGGGEIQAYEFTVGPGGSKDILANAKTYAILSGNTSGFAPGDAQDPLNRRVGESVYLSGVPGLADGKYTLLPAHYGLLPGAWVVRVDTGISNVVPGKGYTRTDGVRIASGYMTDSRANAPKDATWQGIEVLSADQARARSELTVSTASSIFAGSKFRPVDAGLLSISSTGAGSNALTLDAKFSMAPATGGRGASVDISAAALALTSGNPSGVDPSAVRVSVDKLNAIGATSILVGATRQASGSATALTVGAGTVGLYNDAAHALAAEEVILAATDQITLAGGSVIDAQGAAGASGEYTTAGDGALVRVGSTTASLTRSGTTTGATGRVVAQASGGQRSTLRSADSILIDATQSTVFEGVTDFRKNGEAIAGTLGLGATRVNFVSQPAGVSGLDGITFGQNALDSFAGLKALELTSYSTFDLYGSVRVGARNANLQPTLQSLTLRGAGLRGFGSATDTAQINAQALALANPASATFTTGGSLGSGGLEVRADTLTLGIGNRDVQGFSGVQITANELIGQGTGATTVAGAQVNVTTARISGAGQSKQSLTASNAQVQLTSFTPGSVRPANRALSSDVALGAQWNIAGTAVGFDTAATLPSGELRLTATTGAVVLGGQADVDVSGRNVAFFDVSRASDGGHVALTAAGAGGITVSSDAKINLSGKNGSDAGSLTLSAVAGTVSVADQTLHGTNAKVSVDVQTLTSYSALNTALNSGGFEGERNLRVRQGNVAVAATDTTQAQTISIAADSGTLTVGGALSAAGEKGGKVSLFASGNVTVQSGGTLSAQSSGAGQSGGAVEVGSTSGNISLDNGSSIAVAGGGTGQGGTVNLRAARNGTGVKVSAMNGNITGARQITLEAVRTYTGKTTLNETSTNSGVTLGLAAVNSDNNTYAANFANIKSSLGQSSNGAFQVVAGVEVQSTGAMTLGTVSGTSTAWNLAGSRPGTRAGKLTLRAAGALTINQNLSDGFDQATPLNGTAPATLRSDDSWSYRLASGADTGAANPLAVTSGNSNLTVAAGKLVRTGTGSIQLASGGGIVFADNKSVVYTAGKAASGLSVFQNIPSSSTLGTTNDVKLAQFSDGGGDVNIYALGDIGVSTAGSNPTTTRRSQQLYSNWLFRQGSLAADGSTYAVKPAWWVRFDQFQQGIGALGGGNVSVVSEQNIRNMSASTTTQARMNSTTAVADALVQTGGGSVKIEAGADILGGQFYADRGTLKVSAKGKLDTGDLVSGRALYPILALGDATADISARGDVNIHAILNPHLVVQSSGSGNAFNLANVTSPELSFFSTYTDSTAVQMTSSAGAVNFYNQPGGAGASSDGVRPALAAINNSSTGAYRTPLNFSISSNVYNPNRAFGLLPGKVEVVSLQGDAYMGGAQVTTLQPSGTGQFDMLAAGSATLQTPLVVSDMSPMPSATFAAKNTSGFGASTATAHAATPVHAGDSNPVHVYAVDGDVTGTVNRVNLTSSKAVQIKAGQDIRDMGLNIQHANGDDLSLLQAGRDVQFASSTTRNQSAYVWVGGAGRLEVNAGRDVDLGTSAGIVSRGNLDNAALPAQGADIHVTAGTGARGADYAQAITRLVDLLAINPDKNPAEYEKSLWLARWLTGDTSLTKANASAAVGALSTLSSKEKYQRVRNMLFTALRDTGRDYNNAASDFAGDYSRGYKAMELLFPGSTDDAAGTTYKGNVNLFASRIVTEAGGNIEFLLPGGDLVVGLANTPAALTATQVPGSGIGLTDSGVLGIAVVADGSVRAAARGDMQVNQSRILTVAGGDVLLWSSTGDIDAGKGKKTAAVVPPPVIQVDSQGNVTQVLQGAATGSGIGALSTAGKDAGDVDLIAPRGSVNAGDAGIRARNINIAAQTVIGADNIKASGSSSGTPVVDNSVSAAAASGATAGSDDSSKKIASLNDAAASASKNAQALAESFKPSFVRVEVLGFGD